MLTPMLIGFIIIGFAIFFIAPQMAKFRATLDINKTLQSKFLTVFQRLQLHVIGLKTPFLNTIAMAWSFFLTEGSNLSGFAWEKIVSQQHAIWIAFALWAASLWAHFTGLNTAAATPPVITPLPSAVIVPPAMGPVS